MVLIWDGSSEHGAHIWSVVFRFVEGIWLHRPSNPFLSEHVLNYQLISVPWQSLTRKGYLYLVRSFRRNLALSYSSSFYCNITLILECVVSMVATVISKNKFCLINFDKTDQWIQFLHMYVSMEFWLTTYNRTFWIEK